MPPDGLNAAAMNVNPGGKQPLMRPGWFRRGPLKIKQHMVFLEGPNMGLAKGLRVVCQERFGENAVNGKTSAIYIGVINSHLLLDPLALVGLPLDRQIDRFIR